MDISNLADKIKEWPCVSVCILTYNRENELRISLNKVLDELDYPEDRLEIIVCDNASPDNTPVMLKNEFPKVKHLRMPTNLWTQAWNWGLANARGKYFLVLDDDAHMEGDVLKKAVQLLEKKDDVGILSFNVIDPETKYSYTLHYPFGIFSFWGCAVIIRQEVFQAIGGFDPKIRIFSHEAEYVIRALKAGYKHHVMIDQIACHRKNPAQYDDDTPFKLYNTHLSEHYTYLKHLHGYTRFKYFMNALILGLLMSIKKSAQGKTFNIIPLKSLFQGWRLSRTSASGRDDALEKFVMENDMRCVTRGLIFQFRRRFSKKYYNTVFEDRRQFYPDYDPKHFLSWIPYGE